MGCSTPCAHAAPFAELGRGTFEGVLDMLSGRYPSDDFADLRPRLTWDRIANVLTAREGAKRIAVTNGGTIPDRGLYGVFLAGEHGPGARVGELDEEMVFESRVGETFLLGASSWRIEQISHDRVLVSPAPGEPGKMPFWKADSIGRPLELGRAVGELVRTLVALPPATAIERLIRHHDLDARPPRIFFATSRISPRRPASCPMTARLSSSAAVTSSATGGSACFRPLAAASTHPGPWPSSSACARKPGSTSRRCGPTTGSSCVFRRLTTPPDARLMVPASEEVEALVLNQLGGTAMFAAKFREAAGRALLLPKRRPGGRTPLWQLRKRSADLLAVASRFASFPIVLEAYRECLRDVFDMPALVETLVRMERRDIRVATVDSTTASPFAAALLFGYVANYLYDGDAPLAERRAQALSIDQAQLRELLGDAELRDLLDPDAMADVEAELQHVATDRRARSSDGVHDMLLRLGDLTVEEIDVRAQIDGKAAADDLVRSRRAISVSIAGQPRLVPVEYASRYRDALGVPLPPGLPDALLESAPHAARGSRPPLRTNACAIHNAGVRRPLRSRPLDRRHDPERAGCGRTNASKVAFELAARGANGAIPTCCRPFAADRSPSCGIRSNRSNLRYSGGSSRSGKVSSAGARDWTRCSTRSKPCRGRRSSPRFSRPRFCPRASKATSRPTSTP